MVQLFALFLIYEELTLNKASILHYNIKAPFYFTQRQKAHHTRQATANHKPVMYTLRLHREQTKQAAELSGRSQTDRDRYLNKLKMIMHLYEQ